MTSLKRTIAAAACLAAMTLTGACASDSSSKASDEPSTSSYTVEEAGISFDLPADWDNLDQDTLQEAMSDNEVMDEMTDRMGMTSEQLQQMMSSNLVLYAAAPHAADGFLDNANVMVFDEALPNAGTFELQYRSLGASEITSEDATTEVGDGYRTTYVLTMGETTVHGEVIALEVDGKSVVITISGHDAGDTADLADDVADSLAPAA